MKAMILAAGEGRRMLPLTQDLPKPLLKIAGKPMIQYQIENLAKHGITEIIINHAYLGEKIEQVLGSGEQFDVHIQYSREGEPLETAGGIIKALPLLKEHQANASRANPESFIVVNADVWTDYPFGELKALSGEDCLAHLVMINNPDHHLKGDFQLSKQGLLKDILGEEQWDSTSSTLTFSGISVFHMNFFAGLGPGYRALVPLLKQAMNEGKISGEHYSGLWADIGTPERLNNLNDELSSQLQN